MSVGSGEGRWLEDVASDYFKRKYSKSLVVRNIRLIKQKGKPGQGKEIDLINIDEETLRLVECRTIQRGRSDDLEKTVEELKTKKKLFLEQFPWAGKDRDTELFYVYESTRGDEFILGLKNRKVNTISVQEIVDWFIDREKKTNGKKSVAGYTDGGRLLISLLRYWKNKQSN